jgi:hypothetical protein
MPCPRCNSPAEGEEPRLLDDLIEDGDELTHH